MNLSTVWMLVSHIDSEGILDMPRVFKNCPTLIEVQDKFPSLSRSDYDYLIHHGEVYPWGDDRRVMLVERKLF